MHGLVPLRNTFTFAILLVMIVQVCIYFFDCYIWLQQSWHSIRVVNSSLVSFCPPNKSNIFQWPNIHLYQNLVYKKNLTSNCSSAFCIILLNIIILLDPVIHSCWEWKKGKIIAIPSGLTGKKSIQSVFQHFFYLSR
jgi:hypothetical protein